MNRSQGYVRKILNLISTVTILIRKQIIDVITFFDLSIARKKYCHFPWMESAQIFNS